MPDDGRQDPCLDRIRAILETFAQGRAEFEDEHRRLLRAEAAMVDAVRRLVDGKERRPPPPPA